MTESTTPDPVEAELAAAMRAAVDPVDGDGATRAGVEAAIARRRSLQRRRLGVVAAAAVLVGGGVAAVVVGAGEPEQVRSTGATATIADPPATSTSTGGAPAATCPIDEVEVPGLVRLSEFQIQVLIEAEMVDPATVFAARRGPVAVSAAASEALSDGGVGLDGEQLLARGYDIAGIGYVRDAQGVTTGYVCPDGSEHAVATTTPASSTTTGAVTSTSIGPPTGEPEGSTTTTTAAAEPTTTVPTASGPVASAELAEGQGAWAVYVDAISLVGPPIDDHTRAAEAEDRWFEAQAVLTGAGLTPELLPVPCDGAAATSRVLAVLPDGPPDADPGDVYVMGSYFLDQASARAAAAALGAEVLDVGPITATCVDAPGPRGHQR